MANITTRAGKGSQLTWNEVDDNFTNLNSDKIENVVEDVSPELGGTLDALNNDISNVKGLSFQAGQEVTWNATEHTLNVPTGLGPVLQVGQEFYIIVYNNSGSQIDNFSAVRPGGTATDGRPNVELANATDHTGIGRMVWVTSMDIPNNSVGIVALAGKIRDIDTSGWANGSILWLGTTDGEITDVRPSFPNYAIQIGGVAVSDATVGQVIIIYEGNVEDTIINFWNGTIRETFDFRITSDGTTITGALSPASTHDDLTLIFSDSLTLLEATPDVTVTLTPGTDSNPQANFVYIPQTTKVLTVSTSGWPSTEVIRVATIFLQSAATTQTYGALRNQNWNDNIENTESNQGFLSQIAAAIREKIGATWRTGVEATCTIDGGSTPDDVWVATTSGLVMQMHDQVFPASDSSTSDPMIIVNHPSAEFTGTTNLNTQTLDASGNTLNSTSFSFVLWGVANKTGEPSHLLINLPTSSYAYNAPDEAVSDAYNYSVYDIPQNFKGGGFLIARFTYTYKNDVWTLYDTEDLRGKIPNSTAGSGGGGDSGITTYLGLTDTPSAYTGNASKVVSVGSGETALEFTTPFAELSEDLSPHLGGNLDVQDRSIFNSTGSYKVDLSGIVYPNADGTNGQVLTTDGAGNLAFEDVSFTQLRDDTSPQLGGDLDTNRFAIKSIFDEVLEITAADDLLLSSNESDVVITANREVSIQGIDYPNADGTDGQVLTTNGAGALAFEDAGGLQNIVEDLSPSLGGNLNVLDKSIFNSTGSYKVDISGIDYPNADGNDGQVLTTNGSGTLAFEDVPAGGISNIVEDTSPQLGGDLNVNGYDITSNSGETFEINGDDKIEINTVSTLWMQSDKDILMLGETSITIDAKNGRLRLNSGEGSDHVEIDGMEYPNADGTNGQVLTTNGAGEVTFEDVPAGGLSDIVEDTSPQLGGDLDMNDKTITNDSSPLLKIGNGLHDNVRGVGYYLDNTVDQITTDRTYAMLREVDCTFTVDSTSTTRFRGNVDAYNIDLNGFDQTSSTIGHFAGDCTYPAITNSGTGGGAVTSFTGIVVDPSWHDDVAIDTLVGMSLGSWDDSTADVDTYIGIKIAPPSTVTSDAYSMICDDSNATLRNAGPVQLSGLHYPTSDGTNGQVLATDGANNLAFEDGGLQNIVEDTTPQLGGDLDGQGNKIQDAQLENYKQTVAALTYAATITPDVANGNIQTVTLTGNVTFSAFANAEAGQSITVIMTQDGTGSRILTSTMKSPGGTDVVLSTAAGAIDFINVFYDGTNYYMTSIIGFA